VWTIVVNEYVHATPPQFWEVLSGSSDWPVLEELATTFMSLATSETQSLSVISMKEYVVGERGGRSKNELMTARTRIRLNNLQKQGREMVERRLSKIGLHSCSPPGV
jgi:hypothetical protein